MSKKRKPKVEPPHSPQVRTLKVGDRIEIRRRWWHPRSWGLLIAAVVWNGALWTAIALGQFDAAGLTFYALPLLIGLFMAYYTLALIFNETRIFVESGKLRVVTSPLPMGGTRLLNVADVMGVSRAVQKRGRRSGDDLHMIVVETVHKTPVRLIEHINTQQDAAFIEEELAFILENAHESAFKKKKREP